MTLPAVSMMNPMLLEAVRLYTDPLMPTFGNKAAACRAAGYKGRNPGEALDGVAAQEEIARIQAQRAEAGGRVADYLGDYAFDAARELVQQLGLGRELEIINAAEFLGADLISACIADPETGELRVDEEKLPQLGGRVIDGLLEQVKQINQHNRAVVLAAKERREAAKIILAYKIGTPEQRVRVTQDKELPDVLDLSKLSKDQLGALGDMISRIQRERAGSTKLPPAIADGGQVIEAELLHG